MINRKLTLSICFLAVSFPALSTAASANPKYGPSATRLHDSHEYIKKNSAPDFWALMPYYVHQRNGSSCSVASVAMLVNAARADEKLSASDQLVTQDSLLEKVGDAAWKKGVSDKGGGVTLDQLGTLIEKSLKANGAKNVEVEVVHAEETGAARKKLREALTRNEKSASDFIVANFLQSVYTGDPEGAVGHIAPVAAYDSQKRRVLILDPDRSWYEPYWVSEDDFLKGMATLDDSSKKNRGYVHVRVKN